MVIKTEGFGRSKSFGRSKVARSKKSDLLPVRKKFCRFCQEKVKTIDYKDIKRLERLLSDRGRIISTRISGTCAKHQRKLSNAIKRARFLALLPYVQA